MPNITAIGGKENIEHAEKNGTGEWGIQFRLSRFRWG